MVGQKSYQIGYYIVYLVSILAYHNISLYPSNAVAGSKR